MLSESEVAKFKEGSKVEVFYVPRSDLVLRDGRFVRRDYGGCSCPHPEVFYPDEIELMDEDVFHEGRLDAN
jgi:hypothetical protein